MLVAHVALIVWFHRRWRSGGDRLRFVRLASFVLAVASLGATIWTGIPILTLSLC